MKPLQAGLVLHTVLLLVVLNACSPGIEDSAENEHAALVRASLAFVKLPPWPKGDEKGMANTLGTGTTMRCAYHINQPASRVYELSRLRSNAMPSSPFAAPIRYDYSSTEGVPHTSIAWHSGVEVIGKPGVQGTQMDALGHWGYIEEVWDGTTAFPVDDVKYYGGFTQKQVKPFPGEPMQKLGIDKVPPIISSAVLLDAKTYLGKGKAMQAGQQINGNDIENMLIAQGLAWRGLLPGDVLYIYTGWGDRWQEDVYYRGGPGLSLDAAKYLEARRIVLVALDNPFTDAVNIDQFSGKADPPAGVAENVGGVPVHHHNLTQAGIYQIQNIFLGQMAADRIWTSCTLILPVKVVGAAGAPVSPVAIGIAAN